MDNCAVMLQWVGDFSNESLHIQCYVADQHKKNGSVDGHISIQSGMEFFFLFFLKFFSIVGIGMIEDVMD